MHVVCQRLGRMGTSTIDPQAGFFCPPPRGFLWVVVRIGSSRREYTPQNDALLHNFGAIDPTHPWYVPGPGRL